MEWIKGENEEGEHEEEEEEEDNTCLILYILLWIYIDGSPIHLHMLTCSHVQYYVLNRTAMGHKNYIHTYIHSKGSCKKGPNSIYIFVFNFRFSMQICWLVGWLA